MSEPKVGDKVWYCNSYGYDHISIVTDIINKKWIHINGQAFDISLVSSDGFVYIWTKAPEILKELHGCDWIRYYRN